MFAFGSWFEHIPLYVWMLLVTPMVVPFAIFCMEGRWPGRVHAWIYGGWAALAITLVVARYLWPTPLGIKLIDPMGIYKYLLGAVHVIGTLWVFIGSFMRMRTEEDARRIRAWPFRATLVTLLLLAPWMRIGLTYGDEPQYLMLTASLADDLDILVDDEYRAAAYRQFLDITMDDRQFLAGWSVDLDDPPRTLKYFYGVSILSAPVYWIAITLGCAPYFLRLVLAAPYLYLVALAIGRISLWLNDAIGSSRAGHWIPFLFLAATPIHAWSFSLSPFPLLLFFVSYSTTESLSSESRSIFWSLVTAVLFPWIYPPAPLHLLILIPALCHFQGLVRAAAVAGAGILSLALKLSADRATHSGYFAGYSADVPSPFETMARFPESFLSHWIGADAGFLYLSPVILILLSATFHSLRYFSSYRWFSGFLLLHLLFSGAYATAHYVNGMGRLMYWFIPMGMAMGLMMGQYRLTPTILACSIGVLWNVVFTVLTHLFSGLPYSSLKSILGIDLAWIAPQFGRNSAQLLSREPAWEWILACGLFLLVAWLHAYCWIPNTPPGQGSARKTPNALV